MSDHPAPPPPHQPWWRNWISLAGLVLAGGSLFAFLLLLALDFMGHGSANPYLGILCYIVAPGFLIAGLVLTAVGSWRHRRRMRRPGEAAPALAIDLSRPRDRQRLLWFVFGGATFLLLTAMGSYQTFQYTESVQFCGEVCHAAMQPEFVAYKASPHARVACVECHVGPGAASFVQAKVTGLHQVYAVLFNHVPRPIPPPLDVLRPARDTCEQCHWPEKYSGTEERTHYHYLSDDQNTAYAVRLLVHVGGGSPKTGPVGGIHWHISASNKVDYYATDDQRQKIPWIRVTASDGRVTVYRLADFKGEPPPSQIRRMDCIDCHNRPAHKLETPNDAVDEALYLGRIDTHLTAVKRTAVDLLTRTYSTTAQAELAIADGLRSKYGDGPKTAAAVSAVQAIYQRDFFPGMRADWSKYPDNIGHLDYTGCFRCHDDKHVSTDAARPMPATACDSCHTILAQGTGAELAKYTPEGAAFKHPSADIDGLGLQCSDCHNGKNQEN